MSIPITEATDGTPQEVREMKANNPLQIELRGYEVARATGRGWEQVGAFRPTELGRRQAVKDAVALGGHHPAETYKVRPIVSLQPPEPKEDSE